MKYETDYFSSAWLIFAETVIPVAKPPATNPDFSDDYFEETEAEGGNEIVGEEERRRELDDMRRQESERR
tara:strand:- start:3108 stop:3317 length:210 start_codon:yes stop_codon:yes gene_type:complete